MKTWIRKRKVKNLREKLLRAKEEQMRHRLVAQHYNDVILDIENALEKVGAVHSDSTLINYNFAQPALQESTADPKIIITK